MTRTELETEPTSAVLMPADTAPVKSQTDTQELVLSVVVVTWNVAQYAMEALTSLVENLKLASADYEVIVVDNASADDTVSQVRQRFPGVRVIANDDNRGYAVANNQGFEVSHGRYVLLLNPDTVVKPDAIDGMIQCMEDRPDVAALGCRLVHPDGTFQRGCAGGAFPTLANVAGHYLFLNRLLPLRMLPDPLFIEGDPSGVMEVDWISGACLLLRRGALGEQVFDESFFLYGEDVDLCYRLRQAGGKVMYTSQSTIVHHHAKSRAQSPEAEKSVLKGARLYFHRRYGRVRGFVYDAIVAAGFAMRSVLHAGWACGRPGRGHGENAAMWGRGFLHAVRLMFGLAR